MHSYKLRSTVWKFFLQILELCKYHFRWQHSRTLSYERSDYFQTCSVKFYSLHIISRCFIIYTRDIRQPNKPPVCRYRLFPTVIKLPSKFAAEIVSSPPWCTARDTVSYHIIFHPLEGLNQECENHRRILSALVGAPEWDGASSDWQEELSLPASVMI